MFAVTARFLFVCGVLLVFAGVAFGAGQYQRTRDDKTTVWNANPKPGDTATWAGGRDSDGYASGFGTLTWYTRAGRVYGRYFGNMVRGKLDGPVNVHVRGRTAHAIFDHGDRVSRWARGRAPSHVPAEPANQSAEHENAIVKAESTETPRPRPTPSVEHLIAKKATPKPKPSPAVAKTEKQKKAIEPSPSAPPIVHNQKVPALSSLALASPHPLLSETPTPGPFSVVAATPAIPKIRHGMTETPAEGPSPTASPRAKKIVSKPAVRKKQEPEVDKSLEALIGPPSSLRKNIPTDGWSGGETPKTTPSSGERANLTRQQVLNLADAAARAHGYNPSEFRRSQAQYDAAKKTWSLFYDQKHEDEMPEIGKYFTVRVNDTTKKTSIVTPQ
jgi:hypothetical protein